MILLTARLDYKKVPEFNKFRADFSTLAALLFSVPPELREMALLHDD